MKITHLSLGVIAVSGLLLTSCMEPATNANVNTNAAVAPKPANTLTLSKTTFMTGEDIVVTYATDTLAKDAWIGVIPSATPHGTEEGNDAADIDYKYMSGATSGTMTFKAPKMAGSFDLRLSESDSTAGGKELASVSFTVKDDGSTTGSGSKITLSKTTYTPGEAIDASFTAPATLDKLSWIGIIPAATPHGTEAGNDAVDVSYMYLNGQSVGPVKLFAPMTPGSYDLRLNDADASGKELATSPAFTVAEKK